MRDDASWTAALVATARGLGASLPPEARLVEDPFGLRFSIGAWGWIARTAPSFAAFVARPFVLYMQVRTRVIDDEVRAWLAAGHRQVVLLGAGFDTRASRFREARIFEVDHPATQARKRAIVGDPPSVTYLSWDFEAQPVAGLPAALQAAGHDPAAPTLTIWEGVTMYLTRTAIDATADAVAAYSAPGSAFVVNYLEARMISRPSPIRRVVGWVVASRGEPFVTGFDPAKWDEWASARGFVVHRDEAVADAGVRLLPDPHAAWMRVDGHRIIVLRRAGHG